MFVISVGLLILSAMLTNGAVANAVPLDEAVEDESAPPLHLILEQSSDALPNFLARRIEQDLAGRINVPVERMKILEASREVWPDACLGLGQADEGCVQGDVRGWSVTVASAQQNWVYRSDRTAQRLRLELMPQDADLNPIGFSEEMAKKLISTASEQNNYPFSDLEILEVRVMEWDGCLGIAEAEAACSQAVVLGFQAIVGNGPRDLSMLDDPAYYWESVESGKLHREWVYHLNEDGSEIVQNVAASNENHLVLTSFLRESQAIDIAPDEVFGWRINNSGTPFSTTLTLEKDGSVYREFFDRSTGERSKERINEISREAVAAFERLVQEQRFSELDGMVYFNHDPSWAIDWGATFATSDGMVHFSALDEDLPEPMQSVMEVVSSITEQPY